MRYGEFIEGIAVAESGTPASDALVAGMLVLRLFDAWLDKPGMVASTDHRATLVAQSAVASMAPGNGTKDALFGVLAAMRADRPGSFTSVLTQLMAYGRALHLDAELTLAAAVYESVVARADPTVENDEAVSASLGRGECLVELGRFSAADLCYAMAARYALQGKTRRYELRANIGQAKVVKGRGDLPRADVMLLRVCDAAKAHKLPDVLCRALMERAQIAFICGKYEEALRFALDAWKECADHTERDRLLNDIAGMLYMLGMRATARDAFLILAVTAREQLLRWTSTVNLMELAAEDGNGVQFEDYRTQLEHANLSPWIRAEFELHVGCGYRALHKAALAEDWFERARRTAQKHSLNRLVFAAERQLAHEPARQDVLARSQVSPANLQALDAFGEQVAAMRERVTPSPYVPNGE